MTAEMIALRHFAIGKPVLAMWREPLMLRGWIEVTEVDGEGHEVMTLTEAGKIALKESTHAR